MNIQVIEKYGNHHHHHLQQIFFEHYKCKNHRYYYDCQEQDMKQNGSNTKEVNKFLLSSCVIQCSLLSILMGLANEGRGVIMGYIIMIHKYCTYLCTH